MIAEELVTLAQRKYQFMWCTHVFDTVPCIRNSHDYGADFEKARVGTLMEEMGKHERRRWIEERNGTR